MDLPHHSVVYIIHAFVTPEEDAGSLDFPASL